MIETAIRPPIENETGPTSGRFSFWLLALVVILRLVLEIWYLDQPIFEGYIGRQIPTAMVARDLATGGHFFYPKLQTGPFPSYFLVEPPIYAGFVASFSCFSGMELEASGRLVSLTGLSLAALSTWLISRSRWGVVSANYAVAFLLAMPVTVRYGRAFQPDMLALGLFFLALAIEDRCRNHKTTQKNIYLITYALAMATKITLAPLLIARLGLRTEPDTGLKRKSLLQWLLGFLLVIAPALGWYGWCVWLRQSQEIRSGGQSADGLAFWLKMIGPVALLSRDALKSIWPNVFWKSWTPFWLILIPTSLVSIRNGSILKYLCIAIAAWLMLVGAKSHHAYYWLVPAPAVALMAGLFMMPRASAISANKWISFSCLQKAVIIFLIINGFMQSRFTWKTPGEWQPLTADLQEIRQRLDSDTAHYCIAHEAALYALDRPGLRWEWSALAQQRAASAWGAERLPGPSPAGLLEFYISQGGRWFLALQTDPGWARLRQRISPWLRDDQVVYSKGGLILYDLKLPEPPTGKP